MQVFEQALNNVMPVLEVKSRRVGGATYQVPVEVKTNRRKTFGMRWMIANARNRSEKTMEQRLAGEILDASRGEGASVKKKRMSTAWLKLIRHLRITDGDWKSVVFASRDFKTNFTGGIIC